MLTNLTRRLAPAIALVLTAAVLIACGGGSKTSPQDATTITAADDTPTVSVTLIPLAPPDTSSAVATPTPSAPAPAAITIPVPTPTALPLGGVAVGTPVAPNLLPPELRTTPLAGPATVAPGAPSGPSPCAGFTNQRVRDWCGRPFSTTITCADFPSGSGEATRFTKTLDPVDTNNLDPDKDGKSCQDK